MVNATSFSSNPTRTLPSISNVGTPPRGSSNRMRLALCRSCGGAELRTVEVIEPGPPLRPETLMKLDHATDGRCRWLASE